MAWYPGATKMELQPESDSQPAIKPTQFIVHSIVGPWTARRTYEYWRDSTNLESHFGIGYAGDIAQYIGTETRADANAAANRRADGTGAISVETASNLTATDAWTDEQVEELIKAGVWAHQHPRHNIPLRLCRSADDPGFGWHKMHDAWNPSAHSCPGPARIRQFREVVFPGIVARATGKTNNPPQEDDMDPVDVWAYKGKGEKHDAYSYLRGTRGAVTALTAQVGALTATVGKLAQGGGLDAAEIKAAAEAGAQAALAQLGDALKEG
ncbi:N-acetylmuramoyl-L-alanine amidase [Streptomyces sp. ME02-6977A]|uniref:N-acetylmuramoyl-L-alanine amidase n=1 Tax=Streptomyces sp. ME02-6977A TaxID=3028671 RepID=UPI0029B110B1|nr:N-acetylmuramoyl-L-alanine amidase [Streptomyces sp. ME02-6977A]MDX3405518.1 N-acetylmuramoyl-L-alanine amidase [Streptomyces sp. ME02-6977A]